MFGISFFYTQKYARKQIRKFQSQVHLLRKQKVLLPGAHLNTSGRRPPRDRDTLVLVKYFIYKMHNNRYFYAALPIEP